MITEKEIEKLSGIMSKLGEAHNMLAKTSLSKEEYQPISGLLAKAKVELFNFYNEHKAALQNKVSNPVKILSEEEFSSIISTEPFNNIRSSQFKKGMYAGYLETVSNPQLKENQKKVSDKAPNKDEIIKEAKRLWKIPNKLEAVKLIFKLGYSLKDAKAYCEDNFDKVSDISAEKWKVFSHTSALGNTGDYMSDCGIENGTISFYCELNASIVNERKELCAYEILCVVDEILLEKSKEAGLHVDFSDNDYNGDKDAPMDRIGLIDYLFEKINERKDNAGSWVNVGDRLPDAKINGDKILLFRDTNESQKGLSISVFNTIFVKYCEPSSYWMPLPAPPESQPQQKEVEESEKELEERTERNMDVISDFCEHVKSEVGLVIPESAILSFFNA